MKISDSSVQLQMNKITQFIVSYFFFFSHYCFFWKDRLFECIGEKQRPRPGTLPETQLPTVQT